MLSQLHPDPVGEVFTVFDQLLADRIAYFVEANGTVWHYSSSSMCGLGITAIISMICLN